MWLSCQNDAYAEPMRLFVNIELATQEQLPQIVAIYNQTVPSRMVTADTEEVSVQSKQAWFDSHSEQRPIFVYKDGDKVVGWISFKSFYGRPAYDGTVELAIYLCESVRGQGLGKQALQFALEHSEKLGIENILAFIFSHNTPSMKLFEWAGFKTWGQLPNVAKMDGQHYSLTILGKAL